MALLEFVLVFICAFSYHLARVWHSLLDFMLPVPPVYRQASNHTLPMMFFVINTQITVIQGQTLLVSIILIIMCFQAKKVVSPNSILPEYLYQFLDL